MSQTAPAASDERADPALVNPDPAVVTVWSDISCPWASLALHRLHSAIERAGAEDRIGVDHRAFPLELFNDQPTPKHIVEAEVTVVGSHVPELGWAPWHRPDSEYPVTIVPAMEAVQAAKDPAAGGLRGSAELDAALRRAFFVESRCIAIVPTILDVAAGCPHVDVERLRAALERGTSRQSIVDQWRVASGDAVQGSPHLFTAAGFAAHNPGVSYTWTGPPGRGFPAISRLDPSWADALVADLLAAPGAGAPS